MASKRAWQRTQGQVDGFWQSMQEHALVSWVNGIFPTEPEAVEQTGPDGRCQLEAHLRGGHNITKQALVDKIRAVILQMPKRGSTKPLRPVLSQQGTGTEDVQMIAPERVADGERQATLDILWRIFLDLQLPRLVSQRQLELETERLTMGRPQRGLELDLNVPQGHPYLQALLAWAAVICAKHGLSVTDFSSSFASGRASCLLVHHYLPWLMPLSCIQDEAPPQAETMGENVSPNKGYTAYVCCRLLESAAEERAAFCIQTRWRQRNSWLPGAMRTTRALWSAAARCLQRAIRLWMLRQNLKRSAGTRKRMLAAVARLQARWKCRQQHSRYMQLRAACILLQAQYRGRLARGCFKRLKAAIKLQSLWRACTARQELASHKAARNVQARTRAAHMKARKKAAIHIQAAWRMHRVLRQRHAFCELRRCCTKAQAHARARLARARYLRQLKLIARFQACWRGFRTRSIIRKIKARASSKRRKAAALETLTAWLPVFVARTRFMQIRRAICCLQRLWRIQFQKRQVAVIRVQRMARGWLARQRFCTMYLGMVHIQAVWRGYLIRKHAPDAVYSARRHLEDANARAALLQDRQLLVLTTSGLQSLRSAKSLGAEEEEACTLLVFCMENSTYCCSLALGGDLVPAVTRMLKMVHLRKHEEQFCVVLSRLNSIHACCGAHAQNAIHKVLEALHSLLTRDEERESKHLQHVGGVKGMGPHKAASKLDGLRRQLHLLQLTLSRN
ncbi:hypothetical protein WJX84_010700 [Apatococcus fuscideae]|uniref:Abnormal spindle-like microcephaly-associated protein n=1 Tax=Apatococcus fuscideae TaxID=2026836 RepID=A0AAW1THD0_9CHLO